MRPTARTFAALGGTTVLLLTACTSEAPEPAPASTSASPTSAPTPTSTPTPTASGPMDRSDAALGIQFENLPDVTGDARAALDVYTYFEVEFWRSTVDGKLSDAILTVADPDVVALVQAQVDGNAGLTVGGENRIEISDIVADAATATLTTCQDTSGFLVTDADGKVWTGVELGEQPTTVTVGLTKEPGLPWRVVSIDSPMTPC